MDLMLVAAIGAGPSFWTRYLGRWYSRLCSSAWISDTIICHRLRNRYRYDFLISSAAANTITVSLWCHWGSLQSHCKSMPWSSPWHCGLPWHHEGSSSYLKAHHGSVGAHHGAMTLWFRRGWKWHPRECRVLTFTLIYCLRYCLNKK